MTDELDAFVDTLPNEKMPELESLTQRIALNTSEYCKDIIHAKNNPLGIYVYVASILGLLTAARLIMKRMEAVNPAAAEMMRQTVKKDVRGIW